jgi:hypothetical protein
MVKNTGSNTFKSYFNVQKILWLSIPDLDTRAVFSGSFMRFHLDPLKT